MFNSIFSSCSSIVLTWCSGRGGGGGEVHHIWTVVPLSVLWCLWKARNNARFEGMRLDDPKVIKMVDQLLGQLGTAGSRPHTLGVTLTIHERS